MKQEFMIGTYNLNLSMMKKIVAKAIQIYNNNRPHWSNFMLTPNQMHTQKNMNYKTYKTKKNQQ